MKLKQFLLFTVKIRHVIWYEVQCSNKTILIVFKGNGNKIDKIQYNTIQYNTIQYNTLFIVGKTLSYQLVYRFFTEKINKII